MTQWGLDALFNPAKRHMDEEKQRLESTREEAGDSSGGRRIDFEAGRITIRRQDDADEAAEGADAAEDADADAADRDADAAGSPTPAPAAAKRPLSDAQRRAALRRGRNPDA